MIAESVYRHDAGVFPYAPPRMTLHEDRERRDRLPVDRPSPLFASFGDPRILDVGRRLGQSVDALLGGIGLPVPAALA